jgi:hypothetical protein
MNSSGGIVALAAGNYAGQRFWRKGAGEATKKRGNLWRFAPSLHLSIVRKLIPTESGIAASI